MIPHILPLCPFQWIDNCQTDENAHAQRDTREDANGTTLLGPDKAHDPDHDEHESDECGRDGDIVACFEELDRGFLLAYGADLFEAGVRAP